MKDLKQKNIQINFTHNLKICRKAKGLSQRKAAMIINVGTARWGAWEENRCMPNMEILIRIASFFEVDLIQFVTTKFKEDIII